MSSRGFTGYAFGRAEARQVARMTQTPTRDEMRFGSRKETAT
jgi:hypothetical protein